MANVFEIGIAFPTTDLSDLVLWDLFEWQLGGPANSEAVSAVFTHRRPHMETQAFRNWPVVVCWQGCPTGSQI